MGATVTASDFQKTIDSIFKNINTMGNDINRCVAKYNHGPGMWAEFTSFFSHELDKVRAALIKLVDDFNAFVKKVAPMVSPGNPIAMIEMANKWRDVQSQLSGQVAELSASQFPATYSWGGRDGWAYGGIVTDQQAAVSGIFPHADAMASHLEGHATDVINGWTTIAHSVMTMQLTLAKDAGSFITADPLKWLDIVPLIINLVADLAGSVADGLADLEAYATTAISEMEELKGELSTVTGSRAGLWPAADFAVD